MIKSQVYLLDSVYIHWLVGWSSTALFIFIDQQMQEWKFSYRHSLASVSVFW